MYKDQRITLIMPVLNEAQTLGTVLTNLQQKPIIDEIIVSDNGSSDDSIAIALAAGVTVVKATPQGYGRACAVGIAAIQATDIVVFMDADGSDNPCDLPLLLETIIQGYDLCMGSRTQGKAEQGALTFPQRFGNFLATQLISLFWKHTYTDLGPFRAINYAALQKLGMTDKYYGWTCEMQIKALQHHLKIKEIPVRYHKRQGGQSKISGSVIGSAKAGYCILATLIKSVLNR